MQFKTKNYIHQQEIFDKIKDLPYHALFLEMGTGKTKIAIDLLRYRCYEQKKVVSCLIICPKIAMLNWVDEFKIHSSIVEHVQVLTGSGTVKYTKLTNTNKEIFIINFESITSVYKLLYRKWEVMIIDESHRIKNIKAKSTMAILALSTKANYKYILSGTPILNNPMDIFSQFKFLDGGRTFGNSFMSFKTGYFIDENLAIQAKLAAGNKRYFPRYILNPLLEAAFKAKVRSISSSVKKEDCLDLPPKVYNMIKLEMSPKQRKMYDEMKEHLIAMLEATDFATVASTAAVKLMRLRQISSGFVSIDGENTIALFEDNPKLEATLEVLEEVTSTDKCIIWCCFRANIEMLRDKLAKYNPAVIYGGTDANAKYREQVKFKSDDSCRVMIAHPRSAGLAINLVNAKYVIYYSQGYELEYRKQSEDRNHRPGSEIHDKIVYTDLAYTNSIDTIISAALRKKDNIGSDIIRQIKLLKEGDV